jgi:N-glycosylase/DNA lyase
VLLVLNAIAKSTAGRINISGDELNLTYTLTPGQSFRWQRDHLGKWVGVIRGRVLRIWQEEAGIGYEVNPRGSDDEALVRDYFRLDVDLSRIYSEFTRADQKMFEIIQLLRGLRVLRQDPEETLLSYICSVANSVPRISKSIETMSRLYGDRIATLDGHDYYSFPTAKTLASASVDELANLCGLGFRGVNLVSVARQLVERSEGWLSSLRQATYEEARRELLKICGVGLKIADCVLLFSLDKDNAFPVDRHVHRVAVEHYLPQLRCKTLTPCVYNQIACYFQQKFGQYAGWAQEYIFYYDLLCKRQGKIL